METNKLLTLEEIEEMQAGIDSLRETYINVTESMQSIPKMDTLLATARAYWEMKNQYDIITSEFDSSGRFINKPHLPTLKVIVEAMEAGREFAGRIDDDTVVFNSYEAIKYLEKHLE